MATEFRSRPISIGGVVVELCYQPSEHLVQLRVVNEYNKAILILAEISMRNDEDPTEPNITSQLS